jgi:hypothetical protein
MWHIAAHRRAVQIVIKQCNSLAVDGPSQPPVREQFEAEKNGVTVPGHRLAHACTDADMK